MKTAVRLIFLVMVSAWAACAAPTAEMVPAGETEASPGTCPQERRTPTAPAEFLSLRNPRAGSPQASAAGRALFLKEARPLPCKLCHGARGDGRGDPDFDSTPPARNFTCAATMNALSDGQLFWIIRNGSPKTAMPAYKGSLSDTDIWNLITYIRSLASKVQ